MSTKEMTHKRASMALWGGVLCIALLVGSIVYQQWETHPSMESLHGTWIAPARTISSFKLKSTNQTPFTNEQLQGQWTWLFFGFTTCPQLCPTTMAKLAKAYQELKQKGVKPLPHIVMVTLDPTEDSLEKLKHYVHSFDVDFEGARGSDKQVQSLARELGIAYMEMPGNMTNGKQNKSIEHTGAVMVVNTAGNLQAFFNAPFSVAELVDNHQLLIHK